MNAVTPGLIIDIEARINKLERGLKQANDRQRKAATEMERRAKQSADKINATYGQMSNGIAAQFGKLKGLALPFLGGLAGGIAAGGATALIGNLDRVAEGIANIGNEAARAGLSATAFQEWKFVADQNRIGVDALVDGFKELSLRADEFIATGIGPAAEAFNRLGLRADDLKAKLKDPSALMLEILGRLEGFDKAAQIRIADEVFGGTGGERFVELLASGQGELRNTINRAHEVGAVLDDELIRKADEVNRKFGELTTSVGNFTKRAIVGIAEMGTELADFRERLDGIFDSEAEGRAILGNEVYDALSRDRQAVDDQADALARLDERYASLAEEAGRAGVAMLDAISRLDSMGYDQAADGLRLAYEEMQNLVQAFRDGEISGEDFTARLAEIEAAASDAFGTLEAGDRVQFTGVMSQLGRLGSVIASVTSMANSLTSALARAAGTAPDQKATQAMRDRHAAEAASMDSMEAQREALDGFNEAEQARNAATSEQLRLQREVEAVQKRAGEAGATLTTGQATETAQDAIAAEDARAAADRASRADGSGGAGAGGSGGGGGSAKVDEYAREAQSIRDRTQALQIEAGVMVAVATSHQGYGDAVEFARQKAELLHAAQQAGKQITPELMAEIDGLAQAYVTAGLNAEEAADKLNRIKDQSDRGKNALEGMFGSILDGSKSAGQAVAELLMEIAKAQMLKLIFQIPGMSGISNTVGGMTGGFAEGGYTGDGGKYQPAGIVHAGEFVISKEAVNNLGVGNLEALHRAAKTGATGYARGGLVGMAGKAARAASDSPKASAGASAPNITLNAPVTVNASGGTPEQNADLAKQVSQETERAMRGLIRDELVRQSRPGAMLAGRR